MKRKLFVTAVGLLTALGMSATVLGFSEEEAKVCEANIEALAFRCTIAGQDAFMELQQKYYVPEKDARYLQDLMTEREVRKATYDYICKVSWERIQNKKRIDSLYQDSIDVRLMPENSSIAGENISLALRFSGRMGVDATGYGRIMALGLDVAKHLRRDAHYRYDMEVMDSLRNILTKEQLVRILRSKNMQKAIDRGVAAWNEVVVAGLIEGEDSTTCCDDAIEYYLQELVLSDMFVGHDKVLGNNLADLWKRQPLIVRMNGSMKRKQEITRRKEEQNENDNLAW